MLRSNNKTNEVTNSVIEKLNCSIKVPPCANGAIKSVNQFAGIKFENIFFIKLKARVAESARKKTLLKQTALKTIKMLNSL